MRHLLEEQGLPAMDRQKYTEIFRFPVSEYYRDLGFEGAAFEALSDRFVARYMRGILECKLHTGVPELLSEIKTAGISQSILSAAHQESLQTHLVHFQISHYFDRIFGLSDHHARGKLERGRDLMATSGFPAEDTVLVGDTDHDLEVAKALGISAVILADGHQSYERLSVLHSQVLQDRHGAFSS